MVTHVVSPAFGGLGRKITGVEASISESKQDPVSANKTEEGEVICRHINVETTFSWEPY